MTFLIIESYSYDKKFMTMILPQFHHCDCEICEWLNFGTFCKFPCIVRIYAWYFMQCRNHHSDNHANHVIIRPKALSKSMMSNYLTTSWKEFQWHFSENSTYLHNDILQISSTKWRQFCSSLHVSRAWHWITGVYYDESWLPGLSYSVYEVTAYIQFEVYEHV